MAKQYKFGFIIEGDADKGTRAVRKVRQEVSGLDSETGKAKRGTKQWREETNRQERLLKTHSNTVSRLKNLVIGLGGAYLGMRGVTSTVRTFSRFQDSMAQVQAITRASADDFEDLTNIARELGATTEFTAAQAADALRFLGMAGFSSADSIKAVPQVLDLATASSMELGRAADITSNIMSAFGIEAENTARITDVLVAASSRANTNVEQMGEAMSYVGPVASALNIDIGDTAAAIGVLSDAGIQGSSAGTGLRRVISSLANPTAEATRTLNAMGLQLEDVNPATNSLTEIVQRLADRGISAADALTIFGDRGGPALLALVENNPKLRELVETFIDVEGEGRRASTTMRDTLTGDFKTMQSAVQDVQISLGDHFEPALRDSVQGLTDLARSTGEFVSSDEFEIWLDRTATGVELLAVALGTKLVYSLTASATSTAAYTTATASASGAVTVLTGAVGRLRTVLLSLSGPGAIIAGATAATYLFVDSQKEAAEEAWAVVDGINAEIEALGTLTDQALVDFAVAKNNQVNALRDEIKQKRELIQQQNKSGAAAEYEAEELRKLEVRLAAEQSTLERAIRRIRRGTDSREENTEAIEENTEAVRDNEDSTRRLVTADNYLEIASENVRGSVSNLSTVLGWYKDVSTDSASSTNELTQDLEYLQIASENVANRTTALGETNSEVTTNMQDEWMRTRDAFSETFADMIMDGDNAFDALANSFKRMLIKMAGDLVASGVMSFLTGQSGGSVASIIGGSISGSGVAGQITSAAIQKFAPNLAGSLGLGGAGAGAGAASGGLTAEAYAEMMRTGSSTVGGAAGAGASSGAGTRTAGGGWGKAGTAVKNIGTNLVAGYAGNYAGTALAGEFTDNEATSNTGAMVGGAIGSYFGPIGTFLGSALGGAVDTVFGQTLSGNAGFFTGVPPAARGDTFSVPAFPSGFTPYGWTRRNSQSEAIDVINAFRSMDEAFVQIMDAAGKSVSVNPSQQPSLFRGLDERGLGSGVFLGSAGEAGKPGKPVEEQLEWYLEDLLKAHQSQLTSEQVKRILGADGAVETLKALQAALGVEGAPGVPEFASGGTHMGGARIVGERGPELEVTGPSRIYSHDQTRSMLDNSPVVAELQALRQEVSEMRKLTMAGEEFSGQQRSRMNEMLGQIRDAIDSRRGLGSERFRAV